MITDLAGRFGIATADLQIARAGVTAHLEVWGEDISQAQRDHLQSIIDNLNIAIEKAHA